MGGVSLQGGDILRSLVYFQTIVDFAYSPDFGGVSEEPVRFIGQYRSRESDNACLSVHFNRAGISGYSTQFCPHSFFDDPVGRIVAAK
jgi:hypothetical protein